MNWRIRHFFRREFLPVLAYAAFLSLQYNAWSTQSTEFTLNNSVSFMRLSEPHSGSQNTLGRPQPPVTHTTENLSPLPASLGAHTHIYSQAPQVPYT